MNVIEDKIKRYPNRASYDEKDLIEVLNSNFVGNVSFAKEGISYIDPMIYVNEGKIVYLHCSPKSRIHSILSSDIVVTFSVLTVDGIVLHSHVANNSINYRSAIIYGKGEEVRSENEKIRIFKLMMDRILPGRWEDSVLPTVEELSEVSVFKLNVITFSIKIRKGYQMDYSDNEIWEGVIKLKKSVEGLESSKNTILPPYLKNIQT